MKILKTYKQLSSDLSDLDKYFEENNNFFLTYENNGIVDLLHLGSLYNRFVFSFYKTPIDYKNMTPLSKNKLDFMFNELNSDIIDEFRLIYGIDILKSKDYMKYLRRKKSKDFNL